MATTADSIISLPIANRTAAAASRLTTEGEMTRAWWGHLLWAFGSGIVGFICAFLFATVLEIPRPLFLLCYLALSCPFLFGYARWSGSHPLRLARQHWIWGLVGAVAIGAFVVFSVFRQDASPRPEGLSLVGDLLWLGIVYGLLDALMLSVVPVVATWRALRALGWTRSLRGTLGVLVLAWS